ncbi:outer membrane protein, partial [Helicobacter labacensis]|uniref:outer membrane protein n=1 Tax=Helicobacter labacensis TaxID=2316079 RepID=UPI001F3A2D89
EISAITTTFTGAGGGAFSSISDLSTGITGITSTDAVSFLNQLVGALESNQTTSALLANLPKSLTVDQAAQVQGVIAGIVGGTAQTVKSGALSGGSGNVATLDAAKALTFLTAINTLIGNSGGLQTINDNLKDPVAINSNISLNVSSLLNNAYTVAQSLTQANNAIVSAKAATGSQIKGLEGLTGAQYNTIAKIVDAANNIFTDEALSSSSSTYATPTQAILQYALSQSLTSGTPNTSTIPASATDASTLAQLIAYQLTQGASPVTGASFVGQAISSATQAQLDAAISAILTSGSASNKVFMASTTMQDNLVTNTIAGVLSDAGTYQSAMSTLSGMLNSSNPASKVLATALANALSARNLNGMLNPANPQHIAIQGGSLSAANVSTIKKLLSAMSTQQDQVNIYQTEINGNATATMINQMTSNGSIATNALNALAGAGMPTNATASDYVKAETQVINTQAYLLSQNSNYTVGSLLNALKTLASQNLANTGDTSVSNANTAVQAVYQQIVANPQINYATALNNLGNLISTLQTLQSNLVNQLASLSNVAGVDMTSPIVKQGASVEMGGMAVVLDSGAKVKVQAMQLQSMTKGELSGLLQQVNQALVYAKAGYSKMDAWMKSSGYSVVATKTPMPVTNNSNGNMYGIDVQFGYKQFFGKKKRWGLRYYASFSWQHGTFMDRNVNELDNFVYGAGVDALYNFYESKDAKYTSGLFAGLMLAGSSWNVKGASAWISRMNAIKAAGGSAQMNTSYFQVPLNIGFRTNINRHNGFEIGLRIPLAVNYYFKGELDGVEKTIAYKRNVSVFFNYVYNF